LYSAIIAFTPSGETRPETFSPHTEIGNLLVGIFLLIIALLPKLKINFAVAKQYQYKQLNKSM